MFLQPTKGSSHSPFSSHPALFNFYQELLETLNVPQR
jgi:hypothetical protein